jgi:hypothetical protein
MQIVLLEDLMDQLIPYLKGFVSNWKMEEAIEMVQMRQRIGLWEATNPVKIGIPETSVSKRTDQS